MNSLELERLEAVWNRWPQVETSPNGLDPDQVLSQDLLMALRDASALAYDAGRTDLAERLGRWVRQLNEAIAAQAMNQPSASEMWYG